MKNKPSDCDNATAMRKVRMSLNDLHKSLLKLHTGTGDDPELGNLISMQYELTAKILEYIK